jgi:hypothetical protein
MPDVAFMVNIFICDMDFAAGREDDVFGLFERSHHVSKDAGAERGSTGCRTKKNARIGATSTLFAFTNDGFRFIKVQQFTIS